MKRTALTLAVLLCATAALGRNEQDDDFVDAMILHHRHGIEMARLAVEKGQHAELRELAQTMIADQEQDIRDLLPMRDTGEDPMRDELADMPGMMGMDMSWLQEKNGNEFDLAFLIAMSEHHLGGIRMARDEVRLGSDRRPRQKAREIAEKQARERETMLRWKRAWSIRDRAMLVPAKNVCMVNDSSMANEQIPIEVDGRTYYGCCPMCKERLGKEEAARYAFDPVSGRKVDKATAVIGALPGGRVLYFETIETFAAYNASIVTQHP